MISSICTIYPPEVFGFIYTFVLITDSKMNLKFALYCNKILNEIFWKLSLYQPKGTMPGIIVESSDFQKVILSNYCS